MNNGFFEKLNAAIEQSIRKSFGAFFEQSRNTPGYDLFMDLLFPSGRSERIGEFGESLTKSAVMSQIDGYYKVLSNILVPIGNVKTEIDLIMIHEKGIFVFESKNFGGWIFGSESQKYWTQSMKGGRKYRFYNPVWQNKTHCDAIRNITGVSDDKIFSYIVFSDRCSLKACPGNTLHRTICHRYNLGRDVRSDLNRRANVFSPLDVDAIFNYLQRYIPSREEMEAHKIRIQGFK